MSFATNTVRRVARALVSSAAASVVDVAALALLVTLAHVAAGPAAAVGGVLGGGVNFLVSRRWVFRARGTSALRQAALYGVLVVLGSALLGATVVHVSTQLGASWMVAKAAATALVFALWTYPISTFVVFSKEIRS
jgi:putative flippase GtrA